MYGWIAAGVVAFILFSSKKASAATTQQGSTVARPTVGAPRGTVGTATGARPPNAASIATAASQAALRMIQSLTQKSQAQQPKTPPGGSMKSAPGIATGDARFPQAGTPQDKDGDGLPDWATFLDPNQAIINDTNKSNPDIWRPGDDPFVPDLWLPSGVSEQQISDALNAGDPLAGIVLASPDVSDLPVNQDMWAFLDSGGAGDASSWFGGDLGFDAIAMPAPDAGEIQGDLGGMWDFLGDFGTDFGFDSGFDSGSGDFSNFYW